MIVKPASFPMLGFDCVTQMTPALARGLYDNGMRFAVRYLGSLTVAERDDILGAGLALSCVTYSRAPGWMPTPGMGTADGARDVSNLHAAGIPQGATAWIDLEGVDPSATVDDVATWVTERGACLRAAGYDVGLYVGYQQPLNGAQLYALPNVDRYWRSLSQGVPEPSCGWSMLQLYKTTLIAGVQVDVDVVEYDHRDRLPLFVTP